jgi:rod shape-determining protein MreD
MASPAKPHNGGIILLTIVAAMILTLLPLPDALRFARPEWVLLSLFYWAMALPMRVNIGIAWVTGLLMDVLTGGALGGTALAYTITIYFVVQFHLQLRQYPLWQQAAIILSLVLVARLIVVAFHVDGIQWSILLTASSSTLIWPLVYALLRRVRRSFGVS